SLECAEGACPGGVPRLCLAVAALLGSDGIPEAVFSAPAMTGLADGRGGPAAVGSALLSLQAAGLLTLDQNGPGRLVRVHPEVCSMVLSVMPDSMREKAARTAARALLQAWPDDAERSPLACDLRACAASLGDSATAILWSGDL